MSMRIIHFFRTHLVAELALLFVLIAVVPLIFVMATHYNHAQKGFTKDIVNRLDLIADTRRDKIEFYTHERLKQLQVLANLPQLPQMMHELDEVLARYGAGSKEYEALYGRLFPFFSQFNSLIGYYDVFVISKEGRILFTVAREDDLHTSLKTGPYRQSGLAWVFEHATTALESEISDFQYYEPSNEPAAFSAAAVISEQKIVGAVAVQFSFDYLDNLLRDYSGLGSTGEVFTAGLLGGKPIFTSSLRHRENAMFTHNKHSEGDEEVLTRAVNGEKGYGEVTDYRGKRVFAAWRYVPSLRWALVAKIDKDEAYATVYDEQRTLVAIMGTAFLLVIMAIVFAIRSISRPILHLGRVTRSFSRGNLEARVSRVRDNEIGALEKDFNAMASALADNQKNLQQEVIRQTKALSRAKDQLDNIINFAPSIIFLKDMQGRFVMVNDAFMSFVGKSREQIIGKSSRDLFGDTQGSVLSRHDEEVLRIGKAKRFEERLIAEGEEYVFLSVKFPLFDDSGESYALCGIATDITEQNELFEALQQSRNSLNKAQEIGHIGSWDWDIVANTLEWSDEIYRIFGLEPQEFDATYEAFLKTIHPDDREKVMAAVGESLEKGVKYSIDHRIIRPDGEERIVHEEGEVKRDADGTPVQMIGVVHDITVVRQIREKLENANREMEKYIDIIDKNVIISRTDVQGNITYVSEAFCEISGYSKEELIGHPHTSVRHPDMPKGLFAHLWKTILDGRIWQGEIKNKRKDGSEFWLYMTITPDMEDGIIKGFTAIREDITDKKRIEKMSITDALTGLHNRRHFDQVVKLEHNRSKRNGKNFVFIIIDVDHFKRYNDTYGHQMGDEVLKQVAKTLQQELTRAHDFAFRIGGEEFGIVTSGMSEEEAVSFADRIRAAIEQLRIKHKESTTARHVTISMGIAIKSPESSDSIDTVIHKADEALYRAKEAGRNRVCI